MKSYLGNFYRHLAIFIWSHCYCSTTIAYEIEKCRATIFHCAGTILKKQKVGQCCGAVGRAVDSDTRDPWFESSHRKFYLVSTVLNSYIEQTKIKKKEAGNNQNLTNKKKVGRILSCKRPPVQPNKIVLS